MYFALVNNVNVPSPNRNANPVPCTLYPALTLMLTRCGDSECIPLAPPLPPQGQLAPRPNLNPIPPPIPPSGPIGSKAEDPMRNSLESLAELERMLEATGQGQG